MCQLWDDVYTGQSSLNFMLQMGAGLVCKLFPNNIGWFCVILCFFKAELL